MSRLYQQVEEGTYNIADILAMRSNDSYFVASIAALS
jgi:hypothetical protein